MKNIVRFLILFLFLPSMLSATELCGNKIYWEFDSNKQCVNDPNPSFPEQLPEGCIATLVEAGMCYVVFRACCTNPISMEDTVWMKTVVTGVAFGGEQQAAEAAYQVWYDTHLTPTCPTGTTKTNENWGLIYESNLGAAVDTVDVNVVGYVRAFCTVDGSGSLTPIGNLGGGGGGGLTEAQTASAVSTGVTDLKTGLTTLDTKLSDIKGLLDDINTTLGEGGGGLTETQTRSAVAGGVGDALGTASGSVSGFPGVTPSISPLSSYNAPVSYTNDRLPLLENINFSQRVSDFYTDMKDAPLFSSLSLTPLAAAGGGLSSMAVSFGSFGSVNFDLANYAGTYNYIKGFLLLLGSYVAIRVIILRR